MTTSVSEMTMSPSIFGLSVSIIAIAALITSSIASWRVIPFESKVRRARVCSSASRGANLLAAPLPLLIGSERTLSLISVLCGVALPLAFFGLPETRTASM